jgi:hypothetical protein
MKPNKTSSNENEELLIIEGQEAQEIYEHEALEQYIY